MMCDYDGRYEQVDGRMGKSIIRRVTGCRLPHSEGDGRMLSCGGGVATVGLHLRNGVVNTHGVDIVGPILRHLSPAQWGFVVRSGVSRSLFF